MILDTKEQAMPKITDIQKIISTSKEPQGVVVQASDGRMFFLTNQEAKRTAIQSTKLYSAYLSISQGGGNRPQPQQEDHCAAIKKWLDTSNPDTREWRSVVLAYFETCVFSE